MPLSKRRKKKNRSKPSGPPLSKAEIAARKRKLTTRKILIYIFSILIILSFALSFIVGYGGHSGTTDPTTGGGQTGTGGNNGILFTPVPEESNAEEGNVGSQSGEASESNTQETTTDN